MKTQRDAFWEKVYALATRNHDILLVLADMGAPALDRYRRDLRGQYVEVGIAEQQAISMSAGLALGGKKVFTYAIAPFVTLRVFEQIRLDLAGMKLPVTVVGVGAGMSYDDSGPTHHAVEDIALLRILPNFQVHNITDPVMAEAFAEISCSLPHANYIRLDRKNLPVLYKSGHDFSHGLHAFLPPGEVCLVATGNMVHRALDVAEKLKHEGIEAGVIDVYTFPINGQRLIANLKGARHIFTIEEHTLPGGLGSAVLEVLSDHGTLLPVTRFGMDFRNGYCYRYGGREHMQSLYGLDADSLLKAIRATLSKAKAKG